METIHAIFEGGVFRPKVPVTLPEHVEYEFEPRPVVVLSTQNGESPQQLNYSEDGLQKIYEILGERYESGYTDTAARHNEHQP